MSAARIAMPGSLYNTLTMILQYICVQLSVTPVRRSTFALYNEAVPVTEDKSLQKSRKCPEYSLQSVRSRSEVTWGYRLGSFREKRRETLIYLCVVSMLPDEYGFGAILLGYNCVLLKTLVAL